MISIKGMLWLLGGEETRVGEVKAGFRGQREPSEEAVAVQLSADGAQARGQKWQW